MKLRRVLLSCLLAACGQACAEGRLQVSDAWVRAIPPGATMTAGYATLANDGDAPVTIIAAQSAFFRSVAVHETIVDDGVSKMREIHRLVVAPGKSVQLETGARHLMLSSPRKGLAVGSQIDVTFLLQDGRRVDTYFDVLAPEAEPAG